MGSERAETFKLASEINKIGRTLRQMRFQRSAIYFLAFVLPPLSVGVTLALMSMSEVMVHKEPAALSAKLPAPLARKNGNALAEILLGANGTQLTELMAPAEILGETGSIDLRTVALERKLLPTTGEISILPDYDYANSPVADILIIPSILESEDSATLNFIRERAPKAKWILTLGEGARLAAKAKLVEGKKATTHFMAFDDLKKTYPATLWTWGPPFITDGNIISSQGITASIEATLELVAQFRSREDAVKIREKLKISPFAFREEPKPELKISDVLRLMMNAGYDWNKLTIGTLLYPGVSELGIASLLDSLPRTQNLRVFSISDRRAFVYSAHGLALVPTEAISDSIHADYVAVPSSGQSEIAEPKIFNAWVGTNGIHLKTFQTVAPGQAFAGALGWIAELEDNSSMAHLVGKFIGIPATPEKGSAVSALWLRPFLVGLLGLLLCYFIFRRKDAAKKHSI